MNGIIGMADLLCETDLSGEQREYTETIQKSANALIEIINDILDMSKLEAKKLHLTPISFDFANCLRNVIALLQFEADRKGLTLSLLGTETLPERVVGDEGRLRQVIINLVGNAIKFTEKGGVSVSVFAKRLEDEWLISLQVEDTGIGIPAHRMESIFNTFEQADAATTRRFGGTGLGLSISRMLIEAMGGEIEARSTEGAGSCFGFTVRLGASSAEKTSTSLTPVAENLNALRDVHVLLAEDNLVNRLVIEKFLADTPVSLEFAHDGQQAVDLVLAKCPDLVFMDMSMPVMGGIEATQNIRANEGPQPIIVALTANAFDSDRQACLDARNEWVFDQTNSKG